MSAHAISRRKTFSPCPLSFAQQRLWFLDQLHPHSPLYNTPKAIRLQGALDRAALQQTLNAIVARHEVLRTTFATVAGTPMQVISDSQPGELSVVNLRQVPETQREAEMNRQLRQAAQRPFDLSRDIMLRATLLQVGDGEHVLLLMTHHIASDGWSGGVLSREFAAFYRAYVTGEPVPLPVLPIQYADYAVWERQWLQGEKLEGTFAYWQQQLEGSPPVLELPTDRPRPMVQTYRGDVQKFRVPALLTEALKALSRQAGVTLYMTLLATLQTLLHRYTGQQDIVVGSPIAGRIRLETEALIGFFVNNLVLRTNLSGNPTFHELLHRVYEVTIGAYAHQEFPFQKLVEELQLERSLSYTPLFQIMFTFQNAPQPLFELPGLNLHPLELHGGMATFDLTLSMWEEDGGMGGTMEYSTDLFDGTTISRMLGHFQTMLEGVVTTPEQRLTDLPLLPAVEQQRILVDWNATATPLPQVVGLHHLFEAQVERTPDSIAIMADNGQLTYRQLNQRANQLAHHLQGFGVQPDVLVGLCIERSLEMMIGLLGILKAGGAYVPLDPAYPSERRAFMLQDADVSVLVTQPQMVDKLLAHQTPVVYLAPGQETLAHERTDNPISRVTAEHLAYVIYTSGSTGTPKGVQTPHRAVVNFLEAMRHQPGLTAADILLAVTTLSFDIAGLELFLPLSVGAQVVVVDRTVAADGKRLAQRLAETGATVMQATPATWRLLLATGWQGHTSLKMLCGGEALSWELAQQLLSRGTSLWNMYGPTETTIWSAVTLVSAADGRVSLGRPIANTQLYVLDRQLRPVPIGVPGELYIGGMGVARGYVNRPELTAERFIHDPFRQVPGARLYKTGDLARYLPDGTIEFLGRRDHQVKIRGFRIELGEIETGLEQHPAVCQAVVLAREEAPDNRRLVAYIVSNSESTPTTGELRSFLKAKVPEYMVPSVFVTLEAFPLTPAGKVDRNALPEPTGIRPQLEHVFVAPHDALEHQLTHIWMDLLGVNPIGREDDFFELGGHSLLAVRLFAQIEEQTGKRLPLVTFFQNPTIAHLANSLLQEGGEVSEALPLEIHRESSMSESSTHPIAKYIPSKCHPYMRSTYHRLKQSSVTRALRSIYIRQRQKIARRIFSFTPMQLENTLKTMGITAGDTVLMHSAFHVFNGFDGTPDQVIECVLHILGESGNLVMVSMPYTGQTAAHLQAGIPFDVQQTMSAMGVITEMFRHKPGVVRSLNPAHPILAFGPAAPWLIADHENTMYSCGKGSPFEKLVHVQAKLLFFDVSLRSMTFFHYLEDLFQDTLPVKLYEETPVESMVIDASGNTRMVKTYVFNSAARRYRNSRNFRQTLIKDKFVMAGKIGNTKLFVIHLQQLVECAQQIVRAGKTLWDK